MGKHGTGTMTNNGERMCGLCEFNDLVIGGTIFQHKLINKLIWKSLDGRKLRRVKVGKKRQKCFNIARLTDPDIKQKFNIVLSRTVTVCCRMILK